MKMPLSLTLLQPVRQQNVLLLIIMKEIRKTVSKYRNAKWQREPPAEGMKRIQFSGTPCVSNQVQSVEPLDIFELMFADELVGHITQQTSLYFK